MKKLSLYVWLSGLLLSIGLTAGVAVGASALTGTRTCNDNSIIRCGTLSTEELLQKYDANSTGDLDDIFAHYGIARSDMAGTTSEVKIGRVYKEGGRVTIGADQTVATDSYSAGRQNLPGSSPVVINGKSDTRNYTSPYYDAFILMRGGEFYRAVMMSCGNPVVATPVAKPSPAVTITKKVDAVDHKIVAVSQAFAYTLTVTNTGDVDLKHVVVTDTPEAGITLLTAGTDGMITNNTWRTTITSLAKGAYKTFTIRAKVPAYRTGTLTNKACVDAPETTTSPDACDEATVEVPAPQEVSVCDPKTGEVIVVKETEADSYKPSSDKACGVTRICVIASKAIKTISAKDFDRETMSEDLARCDTPKVLTTVTTLANTGPSDIMLGTAGLGSLTAAGYYVRHSRRRFISAFYKR